jgi:hypothetical protein
MNDAGKSESCSDLGAQKLTLYKDHATVFDVSVSNFVHPFVYSSDKIVENLTDGSRWIDYILSSFPKGIQSIGAANATL